MLHCRLLCMGFNFNYPFSVGVSIDWKTKGYSHSDYPTLRDSRVDCHDCTAWGYFID